MDACELYEQLLGIHSPWRVTDVQVRGKHSVELRVAYEAPLAQCDKCQSDVPVTKTSAEEQWRWIGPSSIPTLIIACVPVATCDTHGEFRVSAAWQSNFETGPPKKHVPSWLLARHLEVFVPKPATREQEDNLLRFLDELLRKSDVPLRSRDADELANYPDKARTLLTTHQYWENIIYGYSTYLTDGAFLDGTTYPKQPDECSKEQTLVLKFILTNYRTKIDVGCVRLLCLEGLSLRETRRGVDEGRLSELICAESHYSDICDYIVSGVAGRVLGGETEVWSQEWLTVLNRWKRDRNRDPVVQSEGDKKERFQPGSSILCVMDYCARAS